LAVANAASFRSLLDGIERLRQHLVRQHDLDLYLGQEIDNVLRAAIELGVPFLTAEALGLDHRDALQADLLQGLLHLVELEGFDDSLDLLHAVPAPPDERSRAPPLPRPARIKQTACQDTSPDPGASGYLYLQGNMICGQSPILPIWKAFCITYNHCLIEWLRRWLAGHAGA